MPCCHRPWAGQMSLPVMRAHTVRQNEQAQVPDSMAAAARSSMGRAAHSLLAIPACRCTDGCAHQRSSPMSRAPDPFLRPAEHAEGEQSADKGRAPRQSLDKVHQVWPATAKLAARDGQGSHYLIFGSNIVCIAYRGWAALLGQCSATWLFAPGKHALPLLQLHWQTALGPPRLCFVRCMPHPPPTAHPMPMLADAGLHPCPCVRLPALPLRGQGAALLRHSQCGVGHGGGECPLDGRGLPPAWDPPAWRVPAMPVERMPLEWMQEALVQPAPVGHPLEAVADPWCQPCSAAQQTTHGRP